jgi:glucose/arabinose dehydrogenase
MAAAEARGLTMPSHHRRRLRPGLESLEPRRVPTMLPPGFVEAPYVAGLDRPTAMEFAPDGRLFVAEQGGALRVVKGGQLLPAPFLRVGVDSQGERGLLGVAFDPAFATNGFVYVYYTVPGSPAHNRVSRFTAAGDVAVPGSEVAILDLDPLSTTATNHNGGAIHFGADGKLYVGVGENARASEAQSLASRLGKVLRINPDGSIPSDNPFINVAQGANRAIWALGLRNPFTFAVQPGSGLIFINDVGQVTWEEINAGAAGVNYGWPATEGPTTDPRFVTPIHAYQHGASGVCAVTGGAFYNPAVASFPPDYVGAYFFADLCGDFIRRLDPRTGAVQGFATDLSGSPVDLKVDAVGDLYYLARAGAQWAGTVYRIAATPTPVELPASGPLVDAIYRDLFARAPSQAMRDAAVAALSAGVDATTLALSLIATPERRRRLVDEAYARLLGRAATPAERDAGTRTLLAGRPYETFLAGLAGTRGYLNRTGRSARGFINGVYGDFLGRAPSRREFLMAARFGLGSSVRRRILVRRLLRGDEARGRLVDGLYTSLLNRPAQPAERAALVSGLRTDLNRDLIEAMLLGSPEYRGRIA